MWHQAVTTCNAVVHWCTSGMNSRRIYKKREGIAAVLHRIPPIEPVGSKKDKHPKASGMEAHGDTEVHTPNNQKGTASVETSAFGDGKGGDGRSKDHALG